MQIGFYINFVLNKKEILILWMLLFLGLNTNSQTAFSQVCDPTLIPVDNEEIQYRERGERCEGFYSSEVSAGVIDIVGVVQGEFHYTLDTNEIIKISSPIINNQSIHVRAVGIPMKTFYRMDAQIGPKQKLIWPVSDVLYVAQLPDSNIGVFGWINDDVDKIYVPLMTEAELNATKTDEKIRIYFRASVDIKNVHWHLANVVNDKCSQYPDDWNTDTSGDSFYVFGEPFHIVLPSRGTQMVCVEITAQSQKTGNWLPKRRIKLIVK